MEQFIGEDFIGEIGDMIEDMLEQAGVAGDSSIGRRARKEAKRRAKAWTREFGAIGGDKARNLPLLFTAAAGVADAASGTPTATADREGMVQGLFVEGNDAAGALVAGINLTALTVNGRNAVVGTGGVFPCRLGFGEFGQSGGSRDTQWRLGLVDQGGTVVTTVANASGAAADLASGARILTTD